MANAALRLALLAGTALTLAPVLAVAQDIDVDAFLDRVGATAAAVGYEVDLGPATATGDSVVVDGLSVTLAGFAAPFDLDTTLTFSGITANADGGYDVASLTVPDVDYIEEGFAVTVEDIVARNLHFTGVAEPGLVDAMRMLGSFSTGRVTLTADTKKFLTVESIGVETSYLTDDAGAVTAADSIATVDGISVSLGGFTQNDVRAFVEALGQDTITGSLTQVSSWSLTTGDLAIDDFSLVLDGLGTLKGVMNLGGYTMAVVEQLSTLNRQARDLTAAGKTEELSRLQASVGMALVTQLQLGITSLRYEDASLADKLVAFIADMNGSSPDEVRRLAGERVSYNLPKELGPDLSAEIISAVGAFFANPRSFEVRIDPESPVAFLMLGALAGTPEALIRLLNPSVVANDGAAPPATLSEAEGPAPEPATERSIRADKIDQ